MELENRRWSAVGILGHTDREKAASQKKQGRCSVGKVIRCEQVCFGDVNIWKAANIAEEVSKEANTLEQVYLLWE